MEAFMKCLTTDYWINWGYHYADIVWEFFMSYEFLAAFIIFTVIKWIRGPQEIVEEVVTGEPPEKHYRFEDCPQWFPNGWIPVLAERDIKKGQIKPLTVRGYDLLIFRGVSNRVHVLDAYCKHSGTHIGHGGKVLGDEIRTPSHGWRYSWEGRCSWVSGLERHEPIPNGLWLDCWESREMCGFVFIWHSTEPVAKPSSPMIHADNYHVRPMRVDEIESEEYPYVCRYQGVIMQHIQDIVEITGPDDRHFKIRPRSPKWLYWLSNKTRRFHKDQTIFTSNWRSEWKFGEEGKVGNPSVHVRTGEPITGHMCSAEQELKINAWGRPFLEAKYYIQWWGPAYSVTKIDVVLCKYIKFKVFTVNGIIQWAPVENQYNIHIHSSSWIVAFIYKCIVYIQAERDKLILDNKKFMKRPYITKKDEPLRRFRRWYLQFYSPSCDYVTNYLDPHWIDQDGNLIDDDDYRIDKDGNRLTAEQIKELDEAEKKKKNHAKVSRTNDA